MDFWLSTTKISRPSGAFILPQTWWRRLRILPILLALCLALLVPSQSFAQQTSLRFVDTDQLDRLFSQLAITSDEASAKTLADQIWEIWLTPTDPELADRMQPVYAARNSGAFSAAINLLNDIVQDYPDYAEAWNQRATLYFFFDAYEQSLDDVAKVLALEPRHFGALSGKALIFLRQDKQDAARLVILEALRYHPFLAERALFEDLFTPPTLT